MKLNLKVWWSRAMISMKQYWFQSIWTFVCNRLLEWLVKIESLNIKYISRCIHERNIWITLIIRGQKLETLKLNVWKPAIIQFFLPLINKYVDLYWIILIGGNSEFECLNIMYNFPVFVKQKYMFAITSAINLLLLPRINI